MTATAAATLTLAAASLIGTASGAHAATVDYACRTPDVYADGLYVHTCINWYMGQSNPTWGTVSTHGGNNTSITLCVHLLNQNLAEVGGSKKCSTVWGPSGSVQGPPVNQPCDGTKYYAESWFTSPTYYYGGMGPAVVC
ncbi:hypothetical protein [Streptomyces sp. NBC_00503]|uniref:hypothetical protein n=1 Tax=Streptomyces sp. NBC_00503 TaxID=2903659 RepID=UPI002E80811E|nr:hypothetical protein [Streptomyces sp. NBC_00503]WUD79271.1 hypothetical protein OG490_01035 [Streptomyces sp. NBC_00503]